MLKIVIIAAVIAVAWLRGGKLRRLAALRLRLPALAFAGFAVQAAVYIVFRAAPALAPVAPLLFLASLLMLAVWCGINRHLPGMLIAMLGLLLNTAAIAANGGYMPVWGAAARFAGLLGPEPLAAPEYDRRWVTTDGPAPLLFLGDVLALPAWLPLAGVWSIGDALLVLGISILCWRAMHNTSLVLASSSDARVFVEERP